MKSALFITAPIRSHIIPSFYLSNLLKSRYKIHYTVNSSAVLRELIEAQGFIAHEICAERFASGFEALTAYIQNKRKVNVNFFKNAIRDSFKKRGFYQRQEQVKRILDEVDPDIILLDIFSATDFLVLYPFIRYRKLALFNPMLNTYEISGYPNVRSDQITNTDRRKIIKRIFNKVSPRRLLSLMVGFDPKWQIQWAYKKNNIPDTYSIAADNKLVRVMDNIPEIILAPLEIEFTPEIKKRNQYYLGLCVSEKRIDTELDISFNDSFYIQVKKLKAENKKIIYCAFGTFFSSLEEHKTVASFCLALFGAFYNMPDYQFILSINKDIIEAILKIAEFPPNFTYYTRLNQLKMLEFADAFITHGGLGSVKESIYHEVPMLVYPLDLKWDQKGNALKIEHHKIGLRGNIRSEEPILIKRKLLAICNDPDYKQRIRTLKERIFSNYSDAENYNLLQQVLLTTQ